MGALDGCQTDDWSIHTYKEEDIDDKQKCFQCCFRHHGDCVSWYWK